MTKIETSQQAQLAIPRPISETPPQRLNTSNALVNVSPLSLSHLMQRLTLRATHVLSAVFNRLPSMRAFGWSLISPIHMPLLPSPKLSTASKQPALQDEIKQLTSTKARVDRLNQAAVLSKQDECSEAEFNQAFDWFKNHLLVREKGESITILRSINRDAEHEYALEDNARLLRHGVTLTAVGQRYNLEAPEVAAALKPLLTSNVLGAMLAQCPVSADEHPDLAVKCAVKKVITFVSGLSDEIKTGESSNNQKDPLDLKKRIAKLNVNSEDTPITQDLKTLKAFQMKHKALCANIFWQKHYQPENTKPSAGKPNTGTHSPKSVMFFPSS